MCGTTTPGRMSCRRSRGVSTRDVLRSSPMTAGAPGAAFREKAAFAATVIVVVGSALVNVLRRLSGM
jgi:hypothetical protein